MPKIRPRAALNPVSSLLRQTTATRVGSYMTTNNTRLTRSTYDRLASELEELETVGRQRVQRCLLEAREDGDLRENAAYDQAREDQSFLEGKIAELRHILETAVIGPPPNGDMVDHGVKVILRDEDGDEDVYLYTSMHNAAPGHAVISPDSPLGTALHGKQVGDVVDYEAPGGRLRVEILDIELY